MQRGNEKEKACFVYLVSWDYEQSEPADNFTTHLIRSINQIL